MLLRSAHDLRAAGLPTRRLLASLRKLKAVLPSEAPVDGIRIVASGDELAVRLDGQQWEPASGQLVMDFEVSASTGEVSYLTHVVAPADAAAAVDVDVLFAIAESQEETDPAGAEASYRRVIDIAPGHAHAYLNLGYMLCESGRCQEAVDLYARALISCDDDPLLLYNQAVALEGIGQKRTALVSYEAALRLQPDLADAHQNAAILYAELDDKQLAIRHFSAFRRLARG
ncbi:tetratricopeptide repeat protein [Variovorax sp. LT1P1]|uniref:tetratricopeptide repeat protein n=1 Tax=Variovorax sp. LT1P1 TaxID=3443730 RepID=UPI003F469854